MDTYESEFADKIELARSLLASNEDPADLWEANALINRAISLQTGSVGAWILKAQVMSALEDPGSALAASEMAVRLVPGLAEVHFWRGAILFDLERFAEALLSIEDAFYRLRTGDEWLLEDLYHEKACILDALGEHEAALSTFRQGLKKCPGSLLLQTALHPLQREQTRGRLKLIPGGLP